MKMANKLAENEIKNTEATSATATKTPFSVVEAYKNIRIRLVSALAKFDGKVLAISSANASEGKSTTAINTAITLAQLNKKILLIDGDARRATIHLKLKVQNALGFLDLVSGNANAEQVINKYNNNLDYITIGTALNNASELLSSSAFDRAITDLRAVYDYIIIDTPPINLVSDAMVIAQKSDALVLVVRAGATTYEEFKHAITNIEDLNIRVLGVIMNGADSHSKKYYKYGYGYKYKYGRYGYGYGYRY